MERDEAFPVLTNGIVFLLLSGCMLSLVSPRKTCHTISYIYFGQYYMVRKSPIITTILRWYQKHKREHLPWRHTRDPYKILVSEVMLQQTQVDRVIVKYEEFLRLFPTVYDLAKAPASQVIMAWQGLGYNRRALFLQKTAKTVVETYQGIFPEDLITLKTLPGVGDYTARAILSFAFEKPFPMMDTNHRRFYNRVFFGIKKMSDDVLLKKAEEVILEKNAYDWNQALMDFGSLICTTKNPKCESCPLSSICKAAFKVKAEKKIRTKPLVRFEDSDRYVRGRIVEALRQGKKVTRTSVYDLFPDRSENLLNSIIEKLCRDGLTHEHKGRIVLGEKR
jgi:A/G-specific adenine glycosylase